MDDAENIIALAFPIPSEVKGEAIIAGRAYKLSASDDQQINQTIDRPQYPGSFQIMILGGGNGLYPRDQQVQSLNQM